MNLNLVDKIYKYYLDKENKSTDIKEFSIAPSYLTDCMRKIYYKKTHEPQSNPIDNAAYFKMDMGNAGHELLQGILAKLGLTIENEILKEVKYEGLIVNYKIDNIISYNDEKIIVEIKTKYGAGIDYVKDNPDISNVMQIAFYMLLENIKYGIILYAGRDNGYMYQHNLEIKNDVLYINEKATEILSAIKDRIADMKLLKKKFDDRNLPERGFEINIKNGTEFSFQFQKDTVKYKSDWHCSYCAWRDKCWSDVFQKLKKENIKFYINGEYVK